MISKQNHIDFKAVFTKNKDYFLLQTRSYTLKTLEG